MVKFRLYVEEEQEILREALRMSLPLIDPAIEVVKIAEERSISRGDMKRTMNIMAALNPDVVLLGLKTLSPTTIDGLQTVRENHPKIAPIVLCAYYDRQATNCLEGFLREKSRRGAYLFRHSINTIAELGRLVRDVAGGRFIIAPELFDGILTQNYYPPGLLKELTPKELETLKWMAKGYKNSIIAEALSVKPKTVENHINSIFVKMGEFIPEDKHNQRVAAIVSYLRATGQLIPTDT